MDQYQSSRGSGQAPAKDFLALTHGQEWVSFYESFDKLVQDHLSRSSELLRRAMSLPEVADREVAQVRAEMEGKLAAERERSHDLLTKLHDEISTSHTRVSALADDVQIVATDLATLSSRVIEALASLDRPAAVAAPESAPMLEESVPSASMFNGAADASETAPHDWAPVDLAGDAASDPELAVEAVAEVAPEVAAEAAPEEPAVEPEPLVAQWDADTVEEVGEVPVRFDAETGVDLTAMAEAESENAADESESDLPEAPVTGTFEGDPVAIGADRPRPHWLSVTRIGSRP